MYVCINIYIYIYIHILSASWKPSGRFLFDGFRRRHHPTFCMVSVVLLLWFPSWQETLVFMVSVVGLFFCFRRGRKHFVMVSVAGLLMDSASQEDPTFSNVSSDSSCLGF